MTTGCFFRNYSIGRQERQGSEPPREEQSLLSGMFTARPAPLYLIGTPPATVQGL